ncbi:related to stress responsive A/B barrel domain protein [Cephalotrichum gorgonifer]|uniref:Related to stress responsive A/B barrel domain protein n=1 Tax=Cephalotrichum gorgonifer TaxID=2041049 RepID=A0AAE8MW23_9PEZI|nr:related to stress responsive A/B barrel domain protein [Cephalotrichum gorgonifer]
MSSQTTHRVTLFKIPSEEDRNRLIDIYRTLPARALKDGKPYILSATAGPTYDDARSQGYTVAAITVFTTMEDMKYYDEECAAHADLKRVAKTLHQGSMVVYFHNAV